MVVVEVISERKSTSDAYPDDVSNIVLGVVDDR